MSVWSLLEMSASAGPARVAFQREAETVTVAQLERRARVGAAIVRGHGAQSLVFVGTSGPVWPVLLFSAALADVPIVPLNYRLTPDALVALVSRLDRPLVVVDPAYPKVLERVGSRSMTTREWSALVSEGGLPPAREADPERERPAAILFTSGTTSEPKGVLLEHSHLFSYVVQTTEFSSAGEEECAIVSVPPYHVAGVGTVLTNLFAGRRVVYLPDFTAKGWLETVRRERVTQAMLVPTMLSRVVRELDGRPAEVPTLRSIAYGGASMPRPVLERLLASFPEVDFTNAYGLTETSSTIAVLGPEDHREAVRSDREQVRARIASAGRAVPGVELRVVDEHGRVCGPGEIGELQVRGEQISGRYLGIGSTVDAEGWFPTRDRAWLDEEGYVFIAGRLDDTIIRGGENIAPAEIEAVLREHPAIEDVAVVGMPDQEWGQRTVAVVVADPSRIDAEGVRQAARARLRGSRTPDDVVFVRDLPYNALGKLVRATVVEMVERTAGDVQKESRS